MRMCGGGGNDMITQSCFRILHGILVECLNFQLVSRNLEWTSGEISRHSLTHQAQRSGRRIVFTLAGLTLLCQWSSTWLASKQRETLYSISLLVSTLAHMPCTFCKFSFRFMSPNFYNVFNWGPYKCGKIFNLKHSALVYKSPNYPDTFR